MVEDSCLGEGFIASIAVKSDFKLIHLQIRLFNKRCKKELICVWEILSYLFSIWKKFNCVNKAFW